MGRGIPGYCQVSVGWSLDRIPTYIFDEWERRRQRQGEMRKQRDRETNSYFICLFVYWDRVSLHSPDCPWIHYVDLAALEPTETTEPRTSLSFPSYKMRTSDLLIPRFSVNLDIVGSLSICIYYNGRSHRGVQRALEQGPMGNAGPFLMGIFSRLHLHCEHLFIHMAGHRKKSN